MANLPTHRVAQSLRSNTLPSGVTLCPVLDRYGIVPGGVIADRLELAPTFVPETVPGTFESLENNSSWMRGFAGLSRLRLDYELPVPAFVEHFRGSVCAWIDGVEANSQAPNHIRATSAQQSAGAIAELETRFVLSVLEALQRWNEGGPGVVLFDLDETLIGSQSSVRFMRPNGVTTSMRSSLNVWLV